jgi:hypothetical protein
MQDLKLSQDIESDGALWLSETARKQPRIEELSDSVI